MSRRHGKYAYVNGIPCTQGWSSSLTENPSQYIASCTPGGSGVTSGNLSETGTVNGLGYAPPLPDGEDFAFIGVASAKVGNPVTYEGDVVFSETSISIPVKGGGQITWSANWSGQGVLTKHTTTIYKDSTRDKAPSAKDGKVSIEGTPDSNTFTPIVVQNIGITFSRQLTESVEDGVVFREVGNLMANITFDVEDDDRDNSLYALGSEKRVRVYVTPSLFFLFDCIHWGDKSNFKVNTADNSLVGYTVNGMWSSVRNGELGRIVLPDGTVFYGSEDS